MLKKWILIVRNVCYIEVMKQAESTNVQTKSKTKSILGEFKDLSDPNHKSLVAA